MIFNSKMLVLFLLIIYVADFCQGKAFPEAEKDRSKRLYDHAPSAGIHQTYDSQSNAEHWMKGNFYQPQVDGQPIYVPSLDQPGSYNEFLDAYYKAYYPAWNRATPVPYTYNTKNVYKNTEKTGVIDSSAANNQKYALPTSKESQLVETFWPNYAPESEDYNDPEIIDKTIVSEFSNEDADQFSHENSDVATSESDLNEFEEQIVPESLKKSQLPKTQPKDYGKYDEPVIIKTAKPKPKPKEDQYEPAVIKSVKQKPKEDQYEPAVIKSVKQKPKEDQYEPAVIKSVKQKPKEDQYEPAVIKSVKQKPKEDQYEPAVIKSVKQKPKEDQYEPAVIKSVKQKPKEDQYEPAVIKSVKQKPKEDQYEPAVIKSVKQKPKEDQYEPAVIKSVKQKPKEDQYEPAVIKSVKQKPKEDQYEPAVIKSVKQKSKEDQYEPAVIKSVKQKPKEDQYEPAVIKSVKQKPKEDQYEPAVIKSVKQKPKEDQYEPAVIKSVKQKPKPKEDQYEPAVIKTDKQKQKPKDKYEPAVIKTVKESKLSVEKIPSGDYDASESEDYGDPEIIEKTIATEFSNEDTDEFNHENSDVVTSESNDLDEFEEQIVLESLKKSELPKTQPEDYNQYDEPVVIKTVKQKPKPKDKNVPAVTKTIKQKPKTNVKKEAPKKYSIPKPKPQENDYQKPVSKIEKGKPNKIKVTNSNYGDRTSQATRKKSKGKRRKQYSITKPRTSEETGENILDWQTVAGTPDELSKKDGELYPSQEIEIKDQSVVKTSQNKPLKTKEKVVTKTDLQYDLVKIRKKETVKPNGEYQPIKAGANKPAKSDEMVIAETDSQYGPVKTTGEASVKSDFKNNANIKYTREFDENVLRQLSDNENLAENKSISTDNPLEDELDRAGALDMTESEFPEKLVNAELPMPENDQNSEDSTNSSVVKPDSIFKNIDDFRGLSSMNSNIWSMLFNPNAEQNRLKQKRCITRSNETGFCTYIQNCEVPHIATSLEQLLNNACVIDDIFIGVCCPEFPVETVKVHWDQTTSDFDNQIEDEFGHNAEDCGVRSNEASELQSWPWKAPLVSMSNGKIFCGGVVVSKDHILTAAHCTTKIPKNQILVRLGQYDDGSGDDYAVVEIKRHAQYNPKTMQNDVALLKLGLRIMNDAHIGIVCLPDDNSDHDGETATLLGWRGIFGTKSRDPEFLKVIPNKECEKKLGMKVLDNTLCTETRKESERTCNADSGAPLVIEHDGKYEVIGILSWNRNDCDQRFPSTFSRVSSYTGWIKNHIT